MNQSLIKDHDPTQFLTMDTECPHIQGVVNLPRDNIKIYNDECSYCYHTAYNKDGLWVCLTCFAGFCPEHAELHFTKTQHSIFVTLEYKKKQSSSNRSASIISSDGDVQPVKLGIGIPGGIDLSQNLKHDLHTSVRCIGCAHTCHLPSLDIDSKSYPVCLLISTWEITFFYSS